MACRLMFFLIIDYNFISCRWFQPYVIKLRGKVLKIKGCF